MEIFTIIYEYLTDNKILYLYKCHETRFMEIVKVQYVMV